MALPSSRSQTLTSGDTLPFALANEIQDAVVQEYMRLQTRTIMQPVENLWRNVTGTLGHTTSGAVVSFTAGNQFSVPLLGLWSETGAQLVGVRARTYQSTAETWTMELFEIDDTDFNGSETSLGTVTNTASAGVKWLTFPTIARSILPGYRWRLQFTNDAAAGGDPKEVSMLEITLGG